MNKKIYETKIKKSVNLNLQELKINKKKLTKIKTQTYKN